MPPATQSGHFPILWRVLKAFAFVLFGCLATGLACFKGLEWACIERIEYLRVPYPDAALQAVVVRTNGGATTPYGYFVHVVPTGDAPTDEFKVAVIVGGDVSVTWLDEETLQINRQSTRHLWDQRKEITVSVTWQGDRKVKILFPEPRTP